VTYAQLQAEGLSRAQIEHRAHQGRFIRVHTRVYAVGHLPMSPLSQASAAVLACGPRALLSHGSAAALWGMAKSWPSPPEVSSRQDRRPTGVTVHRRTTLTAADRTRQSGIPTTSPARTLLDIAPRLTDTQLARAYNDARLANYLRPTALAELLDRLPKAPGARRLATLIDQGNGGPTRSELEDAFLAFVEHHGLPRPEINVFVAGYEVDMCYPTHKLIIELDSWTFHGDREAFERDRERDSATAAVGYRTVRLTRRRLNEAEADRLRAMLTV
jgi:uncharacterized protein DUF559/transcriptional regulator with AbiEi antitoxin domain of type IV toxin-antitoxin system